MVARRVTDRLQRPTVRQAVVELSDGRERKPRPESVDHAAARKRCRGGAGFAHVLTRRETDRVRLAQEGRVSNLHDQSNWRWPEAGHSLAERGCGQDRLIAGRLAE